MAKASDNVFPRVIHGLNTADQAAPGDSSWRMYAKADGIYARSSNAVVGPLGAGGGSLTVQDEGSPLSTAATTLNFVGAGVTASGSGATKTITIAGGSSPTSAYLGYDTIGGTQEAMTLWRFVGKSFTPASDCLLTAVAWYTREAADGLSEYMVALHDNNAGAIGTVLAIARSGLIAFTNNSTFANNDTVSVPRWLSVPLSHKLTGGTTYWGGVLLVSQTNTPSMYYDGSGTDRRYDSGGSFVADGGRYTQTDTTRKYSIRFLTI